MVDAFYIDRLTSSDFGDLRKMVSDVDYPWFYGKSPLSASLQYVIAAAVFNRRGLGTLFNAIRLSETKELIGCVVLLPTFGKRKEAEIGFFVRPDCRRKGIASEASKQVVKKAIEDGWLKRLYATTHPKNKGSISILEGLGLRLIGKTNSSAYYERDGKTFAQRLLFEAELNNIKDAIYRPENAPLKKSHQSDIPAP